jgi:hypothetical protein
MSDTRVKMPSGDRDEGVDRWFRCLDRGIQARELEEKRWDANEQFEDMNQWNGDVGEGDEVTVNKLGSYIRTYRAQIAFNDPRAKVTPRTADGWEPIQVPVLGPGGVPKTDPMTGEVVVREVVKAKVRQELLNGLLSAPMHNTQQVNSRLVKSGLLGWGCLKSGYEPTFCTDVEPDGDQKIQVNEDGTLNLDPFERNAVTGMVEVSGDRLIRRDRIPMYEDFFIRWVPYRNMIIDPDGGNEWADHSWVCEEVWRPLDEVKDDPLFENTDDLRESGYRKEKPDGLMDWKPTGGQWGDATDDAIKSESKMVRLFEIYDLVNERLIVLADGHGKYLRDEEMPAGVVDHPYSDFRPNEIIGKFYPRPIGTDLCPINQWYNIARQMELRAMKRSTRKIITRKGALDIGNMEQFTNDDDMAVVEVDTRGHVDLNTAIIPYTPPVVSEAIYRNSAMIARDFDEIGGISEAGRGNATGGTATETNVMEAYSGKRVDFDRKVLAECWRRAIKKLNDSLDANMTVPRAVMLEGSDGQAFVGVVDRDLIAGDFDVDIDVEDMAPANSGLEAAQLLQFLQIVGQNWAIVGDEVLAREFLAKFGLRNERLVQALVKQAQMQMQMAMAAAAPPPNPNAPPPASEADAVSQAAAGNQTPRMSRGN